MARPICLKCGSTRIDSGQDFLIVILGTALMVTSVLSLAICTVHCIITDWTTYSVMESTDISQVLVFAFGMFLTTRGLTHAERLTCRDCGAVWMPPAKIRLPHRNSSPQ